MAAVAVGGDRRRWSGRARDAGRATTVAHERFGDDAVYVLVRGDLPRLVLTSDLNRLLGLEGCLSGNVPRGRDGAGRRGRAVRGARRARSRCGWSTGRGRSSTPRVEEITDAAAGADARAGGAGRPGAARRRASSRWPTGPLARPRRSELGKQAEQLVYAQFAQELLALNAKYGLNLTRRAEAQRPGLRLPARVRSRRAARATPKARFAYLFPSADSALISVRLKAGLSDARARAGGRR